MGKYHLGWNDENNYKQFVIFRNLFTNQVRWFHFTTEYWNTGFTYRSTHEFHEKIYAMICVFEFP